MSPHFSASLSLFVFSVFALCAFSSMQSGVDAAYTVTCTANTTTAASKFDYWYPSTVIATCTSSGSACAQASPLAFLGTTTPSNLSLAIAFNKVSGNVVQIIANNVRALSPATTRIIMPLQWCGDNTEPNANFTLYWSGSFVYASLTLGAVTINDEVSISNPVATVGGLSCSAGCSSCDLEIVSQSVAGLFAIGTGVDSAKIYATSNAALLSIAPSSPTLTVQIKTCSALSPQKTFTITVNMAPKPPTGIKVNGTLIASPITTIVTPEEPTGSFAYFDIVDLDDATSAYTWTMTVLNGANASECTMSDPYSNCTQLLFKTVNTNWLAPTTNCLDSRCMNYESNRMRDMGYSFTLRVNATKGSQSFAVVFRLNITNVLERPRYIGIVDSGVYTENTVGTANFGNFACLDDEDGVITSLTVPALTGSAATYFALNLTGGITYLRPQPGNYDYETIPTWMFSHGPVACTDSNGMTVINNTAYWEILNVNEPPTDAYWFNGAIVRAVTIPENPPFLTTNWTFTVVDQDVSSNRCDISVNPFCANNFTLEISSDFDGPLFFSTNRTLVVNGTLDYEAKADHVYRVKVKVIDAGFASLDLWWNITLTDVNEPPEGVNLSPKSIAENNAASTKIGNLVAIDPDAAGGITYSINDTTNFIVSNTNELWSRVSFNFEARSFYFVNITATDAGGLKGWSVVTITIIDVNEPVDSSDKVFNVTAGFSPGQFPQTAATPGSPLAVVLCSDPERETILTGIVSLTLSVSPFTAFVSYVTAIGNQLYFEKSLDPATYNLVVSCTETTGIAVTQTLAIEIVRVNRNPTGLTISSNTLPENSINGYQIGTLQGVDPDGDTLTYSIDGTYAAPKFAICAAPNANKLCVSSVVTGVSPNWFDFESDAPYFVQIIVNDGQGGSASFRLSIVLLNSNEAPTAILPNQLTVTVNTQVGSVIGSFSAVDPDFGDTFTFSFATPPSPAYFNLVGNTLVSNFGAFNYLVTPSYTISMKVTDAGGLFVTQNVVILVTQNNNPPTNITLPSYNFLETNVSPIVGTFTTFDVDNGTQTFTYTLVDSANGMFYLDGALNSRLNIVVANVDFETVTRYQIAVRSTDSGTPNLSVTVFFTINILDGNEPAKNIYLSSTTIRENSPMYTTVGKLTCDDPDANQVLTWSITGVGNSSTVFQANSTTSELQVFNGGLDFETSRFYNVTIRVLDQGLLGTSRSFNISVTDVNESPTNILNLTAITVAENSPIGTTVALFTTLDPDFNQQFAYTLNNDAQGFFSMAGNALRVNRIGLDFELNQTMVVNINSTDNGRPSLSFSKTFTVTITDVNEPCVVTLNSSSVNERTPINGVVGRLLIVDPEVTQTQTCTLVLNPLSSFKLSGTSVTGIFLLVNRNNLDALATPTISISISCQDSGSPPIAVLTQFVITIGNINDSPTRVIFPSSTIPENSPAGTFIGRFTTVDPDLEDTHTYTLISDSCNAFAISADTLVVRSGAVVDYEAVFPNNYCTFTVRSTDNGSPPLFTERAFNVTITDVNEAPTDISLMFNATTPAIIRENDPPGTFVGVLNCTDPDRGQTFRYSLIFGPGQDSYLTIADSNKLNIRFSLNYELVQFLLLNVSCTDNGVPPLTIQKTFNLTVTDVNEPPTRVLLSNTTIPETAPIGSLLGNLSTLDEDFNEVFTYTLVDDGVSRFRIDTTTVPGTARIVVNSTLMNAQRLRLVRITVRSADRGGLFKTENFDITLSPVNLAPTSVSINVPNLLENSATGTVVGLLTVVDPDVGDTATCAVVDSAGGRFTVVNNNVVVANGALLDYESSVQHTITVQCTDVGGLTLSSPQPITLILEDVNEPATNIVLSATSVLETLALGDVVTSLTTLGDPESYQSHTYIIADTNSFFKIAAYGDDSANLRLQKPLNFDLYPVMNISLISTDNGWPPASFTKNLTLNVQNVNPCLNGTGGCHVNAVCSKAGPGRSTCTCGEGYIGTGYDCVSLGTNNITCIAPENAASCNTCQLGYNISSSTDQCGLTNGVKLCTRSCIDINECNRTDNGACCSELNCENKQGYFACGGFAVDMGMLQVALSRFTDVTRGQILCAIAQQKTHNVTNVDVVAAALYGDSGSSLPIGVVAGAAGGGALVLIIVALLFMKVKRIGPFREKGYDEDPEQDEELITNSRSGRKGAAAAAPPAPPAEKTAEEKILEKQRAVEEQIEIQRREAINKNMKVFEKLVLKNKLESGEIVI